jgi:hypothetical protein
LEALAGGYAGAEALLALGRHLIRDEAAQGLPLLGSEAETLKAALAQREAFRQEQQRREAGLTGRYRHAVHDLDLQAVLASWLEAQSANFLTRGAKTRRVRLQLGLHAEGELPEYLGPDLTALTQSVGTSARVVPLMRSSRASAGPGRIPMMQWPACWRRQNGRGRRGTLPH